MTNLPAWAVRVSSAWVAIGALLITLANTSGVPVPDFLLNLFTQGFIDATVTAVSAVMVFYQFIRGIFAKSNSAEVSTLSAGDKFKFVINPFKITP